MSKRTFWLLAIAGSLGFWAGVVLVGISIFTSKAKGTP